MVRPDASTKVSARQTSRPPSVTTKDGMSTYATRKPWSRPMSPPTTTPAMTVTIHSHHMS